VVVEITEKRLVLTDARRKQALYTYPFLNFRFEYFIRFTCKYASKL